MEFGLRTSSATTKDERSTTCKGHVVRRPMISFPTMTLAKRGQAISAAVPSSLVDNSLLDYDHLRCFLADLTAVSRSVHA